EAGCRPRPGGPRAGGAGGTPPLGPAPAAPRPREAAGALREAAVRAVRWQGGSVAFPGLAELTTSVREGV
ncbi:hypothetical protein ACWGIG_38215, partial [Streptomyces sp. NPDC054863]